MEILICGVPRSGNVLLRNSITNIVSENEKDYYSESHFCEMDQRVFLFIRKFLNRSGIFYEHIPRGGYIFTTQKGVLRSRHRISEEDFLFVEMELEKEPEERVISTHSLPGDLPYSKYRFCTMRSPVDVIDSTLNFVFPDFQQYVEKKEVCPKDLFLYRWSSLDVFDRIVRRISLFFKSFLAVRNEFCMIGFEQMLSHPIETLSIVSDVLHHKITKIGLDEVWNNVSNRGLTGNWKYHYRKDKESYFRLKNFLTKEHMYILEKHDINELIVALGYTDDNCYRTKDIQIGRYGRVSSAFPAHFRSLGTIEETLKNRKENEIYSNGLYLRYTGSRLTKMLMEDAAKKIESYINGERFSLSNKRVLLYGDGRLGKYVSERLPYDVENMGYIVNDDFGRIQKLKPDYVILCSIEYEETMQKKIMSTGYSFGKTLSWYEVV